MRMNNKCYLRVRMQPRPLASVILLSEIQYSAGVRGPPCRFWPSSSWPIVPETAPLAEIWKQQGVVRATRALLAVATARAIIIVAEFMSMYSYILFVVHRM